MTEADRISSPPPESRLALRERACDLITAAGFEPSGHRRTALIELALAYWAAGRAVAS